MSPLSNELMVNITADGFTIRERSRADFNGDGGYDILWNNRNTGQMAAWLLNGTTLKIETGLSHNMPDVNWEVAGTGDFNADGTADIVWRHRLYGFIGVWFMNRTTCIGVVSFAVPRVADIGWKIAAIGDFNGDAKPDVVWQHDTGPLVVWDMNGVAPVADWEVRGDNSMMYNPHWRVVAAADMNADGAVDLLWRHDAGWLVVWLMQGKTVVGVRSLAPSGEPDTAWRIVGTIDVNHDGDPDLLWQDVTNGNVLVWYMKSLSRTGTAMIGAGSLGGPDWKVVGPK